MKLLRYGNTGFEKPGLMDSEGNIRDLSAVVDDITGAVLDDGKLTDLKALDHATLPLVSADTRLGPCVGQVGKLMCIGLNYADHAEETGADIPEHPILFMKANSAINGPNDDIIPPRGSKYTDWEVELGVVIGKAAKYVDENDALDYVAGYCLVNAQTFSLVTIFQLLLKFFNETHQGLQFFKTKGIRPKKLKRLLFFKNTVSAGIMGQNQMKLMVQLFQLANHLLLNGLRVFFKCRQKSR